MVAFHSLTCSRMLRRMKICSTVSLPGLNPACSFLSLWSTPPCILLIRIFPSTLLAIGNNVTPLQFPHCCRFPFFGILHISPCFHCSGTFSSCQIRSKRRLSSTQVLSVSTFSGSPVIWSLPGAFPFLRAFTTFLISFCLGGSVLMSNSSSSSSISSSIGGFGGASLFKTPSKCSFHLACISSLLLRSFPSLLVIAAVFLGPLPLSCLVMSYSSLAIPFSAAFCAAWAFSAINLLLSSFTLLFTSLTFCLYSLILFRILSDLLLSSLVLIAFLSSISFRVCLLIQGFRNPSISSAFSTYAFLCASHSFFISSLSSALFSSSLLLTASQYIHLASLSFLSFLSPSRVSPCGSRIPRYLLLHWR